MSRAVAVLLAALVATAAGCGGGGGGSCEACTCSYSGAGCSGEYTNQGSGYDESSCRDFCDDRPSDNGCPLSGSSPSQCGGGLGGGDDTCCGCIFGPSEGEPTQFGAFPSDVPDDGYCMADLCEGERPGSWIVTAAWAGACEAVRACGDVCSCARSTADAPIEECVEVCVTAAEDTSDLEGLCLEMAEHYGAAGCDCPS